MYLPVIFLTGTLSWIRMLIPTPLQNLSDFSCSLGLPHSHSLFAIWRKTQLKCAPPFQPHHKAWCSSSICSVTRGAVCELTFAFIEFYKQCDILFFFIFFFLRKRNGEKKRKTSSKFCRIAEQKG